MVEMLEKAVVRTASGQGADRERTGSGEGAIRRGGFFQLRSRWLARTGHFPALPPGHYERMAKMKEEAEGAVLESCVGGRGRRRRGG